MNAIRV